MGLLELHYFRTVARLGHVTRAAEELSVAQPALSKAIARLEAEMGVPLFDRRGRCVALNAFGEAYLRHVERAFAALDDGRRELADLAGLDRGVVAVAATTLRVLPELLRAFLQRHPRVNFRLTQATTPAMHELVARGAVDFCVASLWEGGPTLDGPGIRSAPLFVEEVLLAVPVGHPLAARGSIGLEEAAGERFIGVKPGYWSRDLADVACRRAGFTPDVACEADEPGAVRGLVAAGLGVAFLPASARDDGREPGVAWLHIERPACRRTVALAWREDRYLSAAARQFRQFALEYAAQRPD